MGRVGFLVRAVARLCRQERLKMIMRHVLLAHGRGPGWHLVQPKQLRVGVAVDQRILSVLATSLLMPLSPLGGGWQWRPMLGKMCFQSRHGKVVRQRTVEQCVDMPILHVQRPIISRVLESTGETTVDVTTSTPEQQTAGRIREALVQIVALVVECVVPVLAYSVGVFCSCDGLSGTKHLLSLLWHRPLLSNTLQQHLL